MNLNSLMWLVATVLDTAGQDCEAVPLENSLNVEITW